MTTTTTAHTEIATLLFRKRSALDELPWLRGDFVHPHIARRNTQPRARVSAILVRALLLALEGSVQLAYFDPGELGNPSITAMVKSHSKPGSAMCQLAFQMLGESVLRIPHGAPNRITYHAGALGLAWALAQPHRAQDLRDAYELLRQGHIRAGGLTEKLSPQLCRAADELYFWLRYADANPEPDNDLFAEMEIRDNRGLTGEVWPGETIDVERLVGAAQVKESKASPTRVSSTTIRFVGWQAGALQDALLHNESTLLGGPTGTGKTFCLHEVMHQHPERALVSMTGKPGLIDLDFIGAIAPKVGIDQWCDGPALRAMRLAQATPVVFFIDEITRLPRRQLNVLIDLMNVESAQTLCQRGYDVLDGDYYSIEVPMTGEVVWCPIEHLIFVAAGNFGSQYEVEDLDPAVRRRFTTMIEFEYLGLDDEVALVEREARIDQARARLLVSVAHETRRMSANGELPGCIDTASLLNWAGKCVRTQSTTIGDIMRQAQLTWADLVCGRDPNGLVNQANFKALSDYLMSLGGLPS